jgi:hypothetical protein
MIKDIGLFFFTSDTPFFRIENEYLARAFQRLDTKLPCEKTLRTTVLDSSHADLKAEVDKKVKQMQVSMR